MRSKRASVEVWKTGVRWTARLVCVPSFERWRTLTSQLDPFLGVAATIGSRRTLITPLDPCPGVYSRDIGIFNSENKQEEYQKEKENEDQQMICLLIISIEPIWISSDTYHMRMMLS
ncbi:hypothetical protein Y032_0044g940 [Ancylostoma ceylanicum]|uniref:Uncharacterized protein n=1 Tax=Ancylostoma ceylanicum TaxID=53326 RepID=A0A016UER2_9BILA|nr:hypothetical protein Y032_0044g940 [Ancylostoma ceylanicum]